VISYWCCLQVARSHLARLRCQMVADREAHAAALLRFERRLQLEQHKARMLQEAGGCGLCSDC
jgi:hypothetical protein